MTIIIILIVPNIYWALTLCHAKHIPYVGIYTNSSTNTLRYRSCHHPQLQLRKTVSERFNELPEVTELNSRSGIQTEGYGFRAWMIHSLLWALWANNGDGHFVTIVCVDVLYDCITFIQIDTHIHTHLWLIWANPEGQDNILTCLIGREYEPHI